MTSTQIETLRGLQRTINEAIDSYVKNVEESQAAGKQPTVVGMGISTAASQIVDVFKNPVEQLLDFGYQGTQLLTMRIAIDLDLFNLIREMTTLEELAQKTNSDKNLLYRTLRLLVANNIFMEVEPKTYRETDISRTLRLPSLRGWIITCFDTLWPIWLQTPEHFRKTGFKDMSDLENNATIDVYGSNFFQQLSRDPRREAEFAAAMKIQDEMPASTHPQFPYFESFDDFEAKKNSGGSDIFLVDVGGGKGQYLEKLLKQHPELPGRKIFQDLPTVIASVPHNTVTTEPMPHDFFTKQPVKGAKFYHLRGILHDWPDTSCVEILSQLRAGCEKGYSRVLIHTFVLPETGCSSIEAMTDINMWTCCGKERTENQFKSLVEKAGFRILRIVKAEIGPYCVIETEMVDGL